MSRGHGCKAVFSHQKDGFLYYRYGVVNQNFPNCVKRGIVCDGMIAIDKAFLMYTTMPLPDGLRLGRIRMVKLCSDSVYFKLYPSEMGDSFEGVTLTMLNRLLNSSRSSGEAAAESEVSQ